MKHISFFGTLAFALILLWFFPSASEAQQEQALKEANVKPAEPATPSKEEVSLAATVKVGDTYDQVVAAKGAPKGTIKMGSTQVLTYPDASIKLKDKVVVSITVVKPSQPVVTPTPTVPLTPEQKFRALKESQLKAAARVTEIVNQPVTPVQPTKGMKTSTVPDWFHGEPPKPDFANIDIRTTQQLVYEKWDGVASATAPKVFYRGSEIEFNKMTKYFMLDFSTPKKRLTEAEMLEINGLYREIARCEKEMRALAEGK